MQQTNLSFPELKLAQRDGHKLRGYFSNLFGKESDLFHNHDAQGRAIYRYPRIQYKVVDGNPMLIGLGDGAQLLVERFLQVKEIEIDNLVFPLHQKNLKSEEVPVRMTNTLQAYRFVNPWVSLNQENHKIYVELDKDAKREKLTGILIANMISFFKSIGFHAEGQIMVHLDLREPRLVKFKNQPMLAFYGDFVCNVHLPDFIGLGKSVSRGYGTIVRKK